MKTSLIPLGVAMSLFLAITSHAYVYKSLDMRTIHSALVLCEKRDNLKKLYVVMEDMTFAVCGNNQKFKLKADGYWQEITRRG